MRRRALLILVVAQFAYAESSLINPEPAKGTIYSPIGKRDPFRPLSFGSPDDDNSTRANNLEKFTLEQFQLRAILKGIGKSRAMFEDPNGNTYILTEGDFIGREKATISRIVNTEVILTQRTFNYLGAESLLEKVMSLPKDEDLEQFLPPETPTKKSEPAPTK